MPDAFHTARLQWTQFKSLAPDAYAALLNLSQAAQVHGLDALLIELVKLRCSQINGCAFCVQMHAKAAQQHGATEDQMRLLVVWRESSANVFSAQQRSALAWAEALTHVAHGPLSQALYQEICAHFSAQDLAYLSSAVVAINAWNRLAVAYQFTP